MILASPYRQSQKRLFERAIEQALWCPTNRHIGRVLQQCNDAAPQAIAEQVRQRAQQLMRHHHRHGRLILRARDRLMLRIYCHAAPSGWFCGWCDASRRETGETVNTGIGGLLMAPNGRIVQRFTCPVSSQKDVFEAEIAALSQVLDLAYQQSIRNIRIHTDCRGLVKMWLEQRHDPRLAPIRYLARRFHRIRLQTVPRQHNQPADILAKDAASSKKYKSAIE